jgi:membrane-fusion protein
MLPEIKVDLTPLVQSVPNGVGKIFDLCFGTKISKQKAARLLIDAKARREARLIEEGELNIDDEGNAIDFEQMQADNIQQCIEFAVQEAMLRSSQKITDNSDVSQTFFNQWREYAQHIDENEIKQLWGQLLAKNIYEPETVSLRLLNLLSMLSKNEIDTFINSLPYIVGTGFIVVDFVPNSKKYELFNTLYDIGLVTKIPNNLRNVENLPRYTQNGCNCFHISQRDKLIAFHDSVQEDNLYMEFIELTMLGKELYRITDATNDEHSILFDSIEKSKLSLQTINKISVYRIENNCVVDTLLEKIL